MFCRVVVLRPTRLVKACIHLEVLACMSFHGEHVIGIIMHAIYQALIVAATILEWTLSPQN